MSDFFVKEVTPFAKVTYDSWPSTTKQEGLYWEERWKFSDKSVYNRAVRAVWVWSTKDNIKNWTEFQRRIKHLFAARLELETMMEWILDEQNDNILGFIQFEMERNCENGSSQLQFWSMDRELHLYGLNATNLLNWQSSLSEIDQIILEAINRVVILGSDAQMIAVTRQVNSILQNLYNRIKCIIPWKGIISGGPMLPYQKIQLIRSETAVKGFLSFEFRVAGAKPKDLCHIKDLKFPALSDTSNLWIHHGINQN